MRSLVHAAVVLAPLALIVANASTALAQDAQPKPADKDAQRKPVPAPAPSPLPGSGPNGSGLTTVWSYSYHHGKCWLYEILQKTSGSGARMVVISTIVSQREWPCDKVPAGPLPSPNTSTPNATPASAPPPAGTTPKAVAPPAGDPPPPPPGWPKGVSKEFEGDDEIWTYPDGHRERYRHPKETTPKSHARADDQPNRRSEMRTRNPTSEARGDAPRKDSRATTLRHGASRNADRMTTRTAHRTATKWTPGSERRMANVRTGSHAPRLGSHAMRGGAMSRATYRPGGFGHFGGGRLAGMGFGRLR